MICQQQLRVVIFYEWCRDSNASTTVANIAYAFGEATVSLTTVHRGKRSGRPSAIDDDGLQLAIKSNPEATTRELTTTLGCTHSTIELHLLDLGS
ncbi:unnamed protein product [Heligmosomoides polygyrus]|uniref:HTH_48 domain-containing protein n=1 Tax=Heligmosomoides polygyrus TaxID=6339 RepID=A0A183FW53_HELPZ|nr:unnamed protein product [Heligmosomoides polygyrus]